MREEASLQSSYSRIIGTDEQQIVVSETSAGTWKVWSYLSPPGPCGMTDLGVFFALSSVTFFWGLGGGPGSDDGHCQAVMNGLEAVSVVIAKL